MSILRTIYYTVLAKKAYDREKSLGATNAEIATGALSGFFVGFVVFVIVTAILIGTVVFCVKTFGVGSFLSVCFKIFMYGLMLLAIGIVFSSIFLNRE